MASDRAMRYRADCGAEVLLTQRCPDDGEPTKCGCGAEFATLCDVTPADLAAEPDGERQQPAVPGHRDR